MSKYSVQHETISNLITYIQNKELLIPEIQRPFVWKSVKVRDLIDSLYKGYPVGYIITWKNQDVKVKSGKNEGSAKLIIDGQQRITALTSAIVGHEILNDKFKKTRITISFNPIKEEFATKTPAIVKDKSWIDDIAVIKNGAYKIIKEYLANNPELEQDNINIVENSIEKLCLIAQTQIGTINLGNELDIEEIADIFERVNSKGSQLKGQDFVMSKIASTDKYDGINIRKTIDYFSHLSLNQNDLKDIENDSDFREEELNKIKWIANKSNLIYKLDYNDILRVVYTYKFTRGQIKYFVPLLSGRNFEKRENFEEIAEESFKKLKEGVLDCTNQTNYERFTMIIKSLGFINSSFITSKSNINFSYALFLRLKAQKMPSEKIEKLVSKWFVFSVLTARYTGSAETIAEQDIKKINEIGIEDFINDEVKNTISENFWENTIPSDLETTSRTNSVYLVFLASLVKNNTKAFLSERIIIRDMLDGGRGDIHHMYPKDYLTKLNLKQGDYNQVANYVYCEQAINIKISNKAPKDYLSEALSGVSNIKTQENLEKNLSDLAIPKMVLQGQIDNYKQFLKERRKLMSYSIKEYYESL